MLKKSMAIVVSLVFATVASADVANVTQLQLGFQGPFTAVGDTFGTQLSDLHWFEFSIGANTNIDIDFNRTSAPPDLIAALYSGSVNGVDVDLFGSSHFDILMSDAGPLTFIEYQDDTEDDFFGGPYGDPRFTLNLNPGTYTILISALQGAGNGFSVFSNVQGVPEPSSSLATLGLMGLFFGFRRHRYLTK